MIFKMEDFTTSFFFRLLYYTIAFIILSCLTRGDSFTMAFGPSSLILYQESIEGGPDFVEQYEEKCNLCKEMLLDPYQTQCGHRLCKKCLDSHLQKYGDPSMCPFNEEDCEHISLKQKNRSVFPDFVLIKNLKSRVVRCKFKNRGCEETVTLGRLQQHLISCIHGRVSCTYEKLGCPIKVSPLQLDDHVESCNYVPISCSHCQRTNIAKCLMDIHIEECPMIIIPCMYGCGEQMRRNEFPVHSVDCPLKPETCQYHKQGCTYKGSKEEVEEHIKHGTAHHLELVTSHSVRVESNCEQLRSQCEQLEKRMKDLETKLSSSAASNQATYSDIIIGCHEAEPQKLTGLMSSSSSGDSDGQQQQTDVRMKTLEEKIKQQADKLAEFNLRFQILETASYDGVLLWKIRDYWQRKADAKRVGGVQSLYSQAFYTSRHGYRMCARVYLNGDGVGTNTHLSLFFVVMRGEYDPLLRWPFRQKVTLVLMDQVGRRRNIQDTFRPDPSSSSFQLPKAHMNVASGCPLFISHSVLEAEDSPYLRNDTLFLKVIVDKTDLSNT